MTQPFLPSPDGPVPNPLPPPPPPDPLLAAVVLAKLSPADRAALLEQALSARFTTGGLICGPRPAGDDTVPAWMTPCSCGGLSAPAT